MSIKIVTIKGQRFLRVRKTIDGRQEGQSLRFPESFNEQQTRLLYKEAEAIEAHLNKDWQAWQDRLHQRRLAELSENFVPVSPIQFCMVRKSSERFMPCFRVQQPGQKSITISIVRRGLQEAWLDILEAYVATGAPQHYLDYRHFPPSEHDLAALAARKGLTPPDDLKTPLKNWRWIL